ncbi:S-layer homology domain-containing protein [Selenomonas sp.]|uniref:S-layer homology domain-containing protein n=1 Tax=Selenomonas sp. TaxID=2053611 RepID=UPI003FA2214A
MKKALTAALTTALVVGAASTTFAAANPFSDVPMDHWAYDAVAQLADDGIVEGYGDGTYRGQTEITRYEMAQMVAKAMAKEDQVNAQQKAMIDRLAAEFSEELNNLGVRVANLESRIDNVNWTGKLNYTYEREKVDGFPAGTSNTLLFRLEPTATVNDHWKVKARLDASWDAKDDKGLDGDDKSRVQLKRAYAMGHYGITEIKAGLMPYTSEQTVVFDDTFTGFGVTVGKDQKLEATLLAGRDAGDNVRGINLNWRPTESLRLAGEYYSQSDLTGNRNIWGVGGTYTFSETANLSAGYWKNTNQDNNDLNRAYNVEFNYKGAEKENARSFGLFVAYRHLGAAVAVNQGFDAAVTGAKGWEIGGDYTFAKNVVGTLKYFDGKGIPAPNTKVNKFYGSLDYFF